MTQEHPITPPPEQVKQWWKEAQQADYSDGLPCWLNYVAAQAARWGADQELEACCEWTYQQFKFGLQWSKDLRAARRPKPPSLKEEALEALNEAVYMADNSPPEGISTDQADIIRRALESLPD